MEFISCLNEKIAVFRSGKKGSKIIFIHGNSLSSKFFEKQLNSDLSNDYQLITFDLPGHGSSQRSSNPELIYTANGLRIITESIINELAPEGAILVGSSLGGHLILETLDKLKNIKGCVIFGTPPLGPAVPLDKIYKTGNVISYMYKFELNENELDELSTAYLKPDSDLKPLIKESFTKTDPRFRAILYANLHQIIDETKVVNEMNIPLAVFQGENEQLVDEKYFSILKMPTLWKKKVQIIPNAGHTPQYENPEVFNKFLREFAESVN